MHERKATNRPQTRTQGMGVAEVGPSSEAEIPPPPTSEEILRRDYPCWTIWQSGVGRWWANRSGSLTLEQIQAGCLTAVNADDIKGLADELHQQEHLRETHQ